MVILLVILTVMLFFLLNWLIHHKGAEDTAAARVPEPAPVPQLTDPAIVAGFQVQGEMAYHPGHAWAFVEGPASTRVGVDDFAARLVGKVDRIDLPEPGDTLTQGEPAWVLHSGGRKATMLSPVSGEVIEVNPAARENTGALGEAPYRDGWLMRVRTRSPRTNLNNLLTGELVTKWMETVAMRLRTSLSDGMAVSYPDGGRAVDDIGALVPDEKWNSVTEEFFLTKD